MDFLKKVLEILERRHVAYAKTWRRLRRPEKIVVVLLFIFGLVLLAAGNLITCFVK